MYLKGEIARLENNQVIATDQYTFRMITGICDGYGQLSAMLQYIKEKPNCYYEQDHSKRL